VSGETVVDLLTPPGTGAIATVQVAGPLAWTCARSLFQPVGKPLPELPELHRLWFGRLGGEIADEVILAVTATHPTVVIEVHCHGGQRVVQWVMEQFTGLGCKRVEADRARTPSEETAEALRKAPTLRTASILLDQVHGAFARAVQQVIELLWTDPVEGYRALERLARFTSPGRHLVEPWKVVVAGAPNVGKSSLVNALAGFQRAVVSDVAGTTRDAVTVAVAFDGWPIELSDTAGLRDAGGLEAEGIARARRVLRSADLVVWVLDAEEAEPQLPDTETKSGVSLHPDRWLWVLNKTDRANRRGAVEGAIEVSALTGAGIPELIAAVVARLVPEAPAPGDPVPFTDRFCDALEAALAALTRQQVERAVRLLESVSGV
jgi:tRNA modification GTPase